MNGMTERVSKYALPVLMLAIPYMVLTRGLLHGSHHLALVLFAAVMVGMLAGNAWISAFMVYLTGREVFLFLGAINGNPGAAIAGLDVMVYLIAGLLFFVAARYSSLKLSTFYNFVCAGAILQAVIAALQFFGVDVMLMVLNLFVPARGRLVDGTLLGTLGNPNFLAAYLAISLPFFFRRGWAWFILPIVLILLGSNTTSAVVPAIIGAVWFYWDRYSGIRPTIIAGALLPAILYVTTMDVPFWESPRWGFWMQAMEQLDTTGKILFGLGPGAAWAQKWPLHSEWITIVHQFGLVGLWIVGGYAMTLWRGNRVLFAALLIALINAGGNYNLHLAPSAALIAVIAGLIERDKREGGPFTVFAHRPAKGQEATPGQAISQRGGRCKWQTDFLWLMKKTGATPSRNNGTGWYSRPSAAWTNALGSWNAGTRAFRSSAASSGGFVAAMGMRWVG